MISAHFIALLALAASFPLSKAGALYVPAPTITSPNTDTVWCIGHNEIATWDASNSLPSANGEIYLATLEGIFAGSELASGFLLADGSVSFNLNITGLRPGRYRTVLYGDDFQGADLSPLFNVDVC